MTDHLPPLPEPTIWRWPSYKLRGVEWRYALSKTRDNAEPLYSEDDVLLAVEAERERCAKLCNEYSKHMIATGRPSTPSEWEAHGAEACSNLIRGWSEYGDPPESEHFAGSYAAAIRKGDTT